MERFANHPTLEKLYIKSDYVTDDTLRILASCPKIKAIYADNSLITDAGLASLKDLKSLEEVYFSNTSISNVGIGHLESCKSLAAIRCQGCKLTDDIGPTLSQLTNLWSIDLTGTLTTEKLLDSIASLDKLTFLDVGNAQIDLDHLLSYVSRMPPDRVPYFGISAWNYAAHYYGGIPRQDLSPNYVNLSKVHGIHNRLQPLVNTPDLNGFNFRGSDITDSDLGALLPSVKYLSRIDLSDTTITLDALRRLKGTVLTELAIGPFKSPDDAIAIVSKLPQVSTLTIYGSQPLTDVGIRNLAKFSNLQSLSLPDAAFDETMATALWEITIKVDVKWDDYQWHQYLNSPARISAAQTARSLSYLSKGLSSRTHVDEVTIENESELSHLGTPPRSLIASGVRLSRGALAQISRIPFLSRLDLSNTEITDDVLFELGSPPYLSALNVSDNPLTDESVDFLVKQPVLSYISLANTKLTDAGISRILQLSNLHRLDLSGTAVTAQAWLMAKNKITSTPTLGLNDTSNAIDIIKNIPVDLIPYIVLSADRYFNPDQLKLFRGDSSRPPQQDRMVYPELLSIWSIEHMLSGKTPYTNLQFFRADSFEEIVGIAEKQCESLSSLRCHSEQLAPIDPKNLPASLRSIHLVNCTLDNAAIDALVKCPWLRTLTLYRCNIEQCSLEQLTTIPSLYHLEIKATKISNDQHATLNQLRPTLDSTSSW